MAELRGGDPLAGEPFAFDAGPTGCALLHGFTAAPREMRPLGEYLHQAGVSVIGARLAGHGTQPEDLARTSWRDWYASALLAIRDLRAHCRAVFACGLSLGGDLSLLLAANGEVDGAVAINAPLRPYERRLKYARLLALLIPYTAKGLANLTDPVALASHADYSRVPTRAAAELHALTRLVARELPRVSVPLLVIQARHDRVVPPDNAQTIFDRVTSSDKRLIWLERGGHIATEDYDKESVFRETLSFVQSHTH